MTNLIKLILPIAFVLSCTSPVKKNAPEETKETTKPVQVEVRKDVVDSDAAKAEVPVKKEALDITGVWQLRRNKNLVESTAFQFCKNGQARLTENDVNSSFDTFVVSREKEEKDSGRLNLFSADINRGWLFRSLDSETFEIAKIKTCPPRKRCFAPSFERSVPMRFERVTKTSKCD